MRFIEQVNRKNSTWTAQKLMIFMDQGKATFDNEVQRALVWNVSQKSLLIHSMILDLAIPPLYAVTASKTYDFLDGKQRSYTIYDFLNDEFALRDVPEIVFDDGSTTDINGLKFSQLDEDLQSAIRDYSLTIVTFDSMDRNQVADMFFRLNNGTSLKSTEKSYAKAISKVAITELSNHELFKIALTPNAQRKMMQRTIVIQSLIMLMEDEPCLDSGEVRRFVQETEITEDDVNTLSVVFDEFVDIANILVENKKANKYVLKKALSRGNIPALTPLVNEHKGETDKLVTFLTHFFSGEKGACIREDFTLASSQGSGHAINVAKRQEIITEEWNKME